MLQARRSRVRFLTVIGIFNLLTPSSRIVVLRSSQPVTEMSLRGHPLVVGDGNEWCIRVSTQDYHASEAVVCKYQDSKRR
jgi:hypothetical protein